MALGEVRRVYKGSMVKEEIITLQIDGKLVEIDTSDLCEEIAKACDDIALQGFIESLCSYDPGIEDEEEDDEDS